MSDEPGAWRVIARRSVADRAPWLHLWEEDVQLPDGRVIPGYNVIEMPDVVIVVALTDDGRVIVERAYKHGPRRVCLSLPAGYIEAGEEPLLAAQRELREETGYAARDGFPSASSSTTATGGADTRISFSPVAHSTPLRRMRAISKKSPC